MKSLVTKRRESRGAGRKRNRERAINPAAAGCGWHRTFDVNNAELFADAPVVVLVASLSLSLSLSRMNHRRCSRVIRFATRAIERESETRRDIGANNGRRSPIDDPFVRAAD